MSELRIYGAWAGSRGTPEDVTRCIEAVSGTGWHLKQCYRKRGYGPNGSYCRQHDPVAKLARQHEAERLAQEQYEREKAQYRERNENKLVGEHLRAKDPELFARLLKTVTRATCGEEEV